MTYFKPLLIGALGLVLATGSARALEVDPQVAPEINFAGRALATASYADKDLGAAGDDSGADVDISDSSLVFGFSKYLFSDVDYGFATFGLSIPEDDSDLDDDIFLHQLQIGIGGPNSELMIGRSRLPASTLIPVSHHSRRRPARLYSCRQRIVEPRGGRGTRSTAATFAARSIGPARVSFPSPRSPPGSKPTPPTLPIPAASRARISTVSR